MKHLPDHVLAADRPLTARERLRLILEVCALRLAVARIMRAEPDARAAVGALRRRVTRPQRPERAEPPERLIARLAWGSRTVLERLPGDHRCLAQSLVLTGLLTRRGIASRVVIGVRKVAPTEPMTAHAWVTVDGRAVSPPGEHAELVDL
jgi:hypothetical protein